MSESDPLRPPFLRRVTFLDKTPDDGTDFPVHVASVLLLDGVEHNELIAAGYGWQVFSASGDADATLVSFCAVAEYVELGDVKEVDGVKLVEGRALCGIPVLTPRDHPWEIVPGMDGMPGVVRVYVFVREVEISAVKQPDKVPA